VSPPTLFAPNTTPIVRVIGAVPAGGSGRGAAPGAGGGSGAAGVSGRVTWAAGVAGGDSVSGCQHRV
jgi:hypothetical protein